MILITLIALALAAVLLWSLYAEDVPARSRSRPRRLHAAMSVEELRRHEAPVVLAGYDTRWVDAHLRQVVAILDAARSDDHRSHGDGVPVGAAGDGAAATGHPTRDLTAQQSLARRTGSPLPSVLDD